MYQDCVPRIIKAVLLYIWRWRAFVRTPGWSMISPLASIVSFLQLIFIPIHLWNIIILLCPYLTTVCRLSRILGAVFVPRRLQTFSREMEESVTQKGRWSWRWSTRVDSRFRRISRQEGGLRPPAWCWAAAKLYKIWQWNCIVVDGEEIRMRLWDTLIHWGRWMSWRSTPRNIIFFGWKH